MKRRIPLVIIGVALIAAVTGFYLRSRSAKSDLFSSAAPTSNSEHTTPGESVRGVVTLEEFGDYQCPPCAGLHPELKRIKQNYQQRVRFVFRNLPLTKIHTNALAAAQAAEAARLQGRFWEMHDLLFENQKTWASDSDPRPIFLKLAHDVGLDLDRFAQDIDGSQVRERLLADQQLAASLGLDSTPTILIDGRQLRPETTTAEGIRKGLDFMLAKRSAP